MKKITAVKIGTLPKTLTTREQALTMLCYSAAYYFTRRDVKANIRIYTKELRRFTKLRDEGGVDRVDETVKELKRYLRLMRYMERHNLDMVLADQGE